MKTILLATGASGGHIFPAIAVAEELRQRGYNPVFIMGGGKFAHLIEAAGFPLEHLPAAAFTNKSPLKILLATVKLMAGMVKALHLVRKHKPAAAFGTGGYATVASLIAAKLMGIPTAIHNADTILGRANAILARWVTKVMVSFPNTHIPESTQSKTILTGLPLRANILAAQTLQRKENGTFHLLILGGSQGSAVLGATIPMALHQLEPMERARLSVTHQARPQDVPTLQSLYEDLGLKSLEVKSFFDDLPARYVQANLIIGRAGANTIMEAATLARAAIYCPHRLADNHQFHNAKVAEAAGAAILLQEPDFTPERLKKELRSLMDDKPRLKSMEQAAQTLAKPQAAATCADELIGMIS